MKFRKGISLTLFFAGLAITSILIPIMLELNGIIIESWVWWLCAGLSLFTLILFPIMIANTEVIKK